MSIAFTATCPDCGKSHYVIDTVIRPVKLCDNCYKKHADNEADNYFNELDKLTIEQRIRYIEKWIYDYKPPVDFWHTPIG